MLDNKFIYLAIVINIIGQTTQNLSAPLWAHALGKYTKCVDAFIMFNIMILWYPMLFLVSSLARRVLYDEPLTLNHYSWEQHKYIIFTAFCDALNGALVIPASPADKTPPVVVALITGLMLLPMTGIKHYFLRVKKEDNVPYNNIYFHIAIILVMISTYTFVFPTIYNHETSSTKIFWWVITFVGMIFGNFYNLQQEYFFVQHKLTSLGPYLDYLFWQTFYLAIWGYVFLPLDMIPKFGYAGSVSQLRCNIRDTFQYSFTTPAFLYNFLFNMGYYVTYIAACYINHKNALIGTSVTPIVNALVVMISYPISVLTPDKSVVMIGLVPLTLLASGLSTYYYYLWNKETHPFSEVYHRMFGRDETSALIPISDPQFA